MPTLSIRTVALAALSFASVQAAFAGPIFDKIKAANSLTCGVIKEEEDYSRATDHGNRAAFDLDMCKAFAVATLGVGAHFTIKVYPDEPMATKALLAGTIDLLPSASPTLRNMVTGIAFGPVTFHDGESIMIPNNPAIHTPADLAGKKICFVITSGSEAGLHSYAERQHLSFIWYPFSEVGEMEAAFFTGNCAGLAGDVSQLANTRAVKGQRSASYTILPGTFRKEPLAPAYREGDPQFAHIVRWTVEALVEAEELGVTRANVVAMRGSQDTEIHTLLGHPLSSGKLLGIDNDWGTHLIQATGNYGEIFDRDLGAGSPLRIDRGVDKLWKDGGTMIALPPAE